MKWYARSLLASLLASGTLVGSAWAGDAGDLARMALEKWLSETGVYFVRAARDGIALEADEAVATIVTGQKRDRAAVLAKVGDATRAYAQLLTTKSEIPEFVSVLLEQLAPGGFWATWPRAWPVVRLQADPRPDIVKINGEPAQSPIFTYNVAVGKTEFVVEKAGFQSCIRQIVTAEGGEYAVVCKLEPKT